MNAPALALLACAAVSLVACADDEAFPAISTKPNLDSEPTAECVTGHPRSIELPKRMTLDETHVYWSTPGMVRRAPKEGGPGEPISLATAHTLPDGIAVDATRVYIGDTTGSALQSAPKDGGPAVVLFSDDVLGGVVSVAADDAHVYWSVHTRAAVRRVRKDGGDAEVVSDEGRDATSLAVDETHVYWAVSANEYDPASSLILRAPKGGGEAEVVASGLGACPSLAVDATDVYWVTRPDCRVQRAPKQGGAAVTVSEAPPKGRCTAIGVDGAHVYWASALPTRDAPAAVWRAPKDGGPRALMAWEVGVFGLALDDAHVYFPSGDSFRRVAK